VGVETTGGAPGFNEGQDEGKTGCGAGAMGKFGRGWGFGEKGQWYGRSGRVGGAFRRLKSCCNNGAIKSHYLLAVKMLGTTQKGLTLADKPVPKGGMSSSSRSRVPSAVGAFLAEFSSRRLVAGLALVVAMGSVEAVRAGPPPPAANISVVDLHLTTPNTVRVSFLPVAPYNSNTSDSVYDKYGVLMGGDFVNLSALSRTLLGQNLFVGSLVSIKADLVLRSYEQDLDGVDQNPTVSSVYATTVDDLTIYIGAFSPAQSNNFNSQVNPNFTGGLLQIGGTSGTDPNLVDSVSRFSWGYFFSHNPDAIVSSGSGATIPGSAPVNLTDDVIPSSVPEVWLANGYTAGSSFGRWSGTIDFTFAGSSGSGVPDASRTALLLAPGTLLLLGLAGRSRRRG